MLAWTDDKLLSSQEDGLAEHVLLHNQEGKMDEPGNCCMDPTQSVAENH